MHLPVYVRTRHGENKTHSTSRRGLEPMATKKNSQARIVGQTSKMQFILELATWLREKYNGWYIMWSREIKVVSK